MALDNGASVILPAESALQEMFRRGLGNQASSVCLLHPQVLFPIFFISTEPASRGIEDLAFQLGQANYLTISHPGLPMARQQGSVHKDVPCFVAAC